MFWFHTINLFFSLNSVFLDTWAQVFVFSLETPLYINDVTLQNIDDNKEVVLQAIADALDVSSAQISLNDLEELENGRIGVNVGHMNDVVIPDDFATQVGANLQTYTDFTDASVSYVRNAFTFQIHLSSKYGHLKML